MVEVAGEELEGVELASRQPEVGKKAGGLKEVELASRRLGG